MSLFSNHRLLTTKLLGALKIKSPLLLIFHVDDDFCVCKNEAKHDETRFDSGVGEITGKIY